MGAAPEAYLLTNILLGFVIATPLLVLVAVLAAKWTSAMVFAAVYPDTSLYVFDRAYHLLLRVPGHTWWVGTGLVLAKCWISTLGTGAIAYHLAAVPKESVRDVNRTIAHAIIGATLWVIVIHAAFAFGEFPGA